MAADSGVALHDPKSRETSSAATEAAAKRQAVLLCKTKPAEISAASATANAEHVSDALQTHGVVRINAVLAPAVAAALLTHVNQSLEAALRSARDQLAIEVGDVYVAFFGNVLERKNRHDLKLDLTPQLQEAVGQLLTAVGPTVAACLGEDAILYECAALISDPESPQQPFHPDTPYREDQGIAVLTAFVALQPIDEQMGPTKFIPGSHTAAAHAAFNSLKDGGRAKLELLRSRPCWRGILDMGDVTLFDSRLLHCGGANASPRRRVLFYLSFRAKNATAPPGTLLFDLREKHSLTDCLRWSAGASDLRAEGRS